MEIKGAFQGNCTVPSFNPAHSLDIRQSIIIPNQCLFKCDLICRICILKCLTKHIFRPFSIGRDLEGVIIRGAAQEILQDSSAIFHKDIVEEIHIL